MIVGKNPTKNISDLMTTGSQDPDSSHPSFLSKLSDIHNTSWLCQKQQKFEEMTELIKLSLDLIKQEKRNHDYPPSLILLKRYKIQRTLHLSAVLSFTKNHPQALLSGKKALKSIFSLLENISSIVQKLFQKSLSKGSEKLKKIRKIIEKILSNSFEKPGLTLTQDWVSTFNMGNMMTIQEFKHSEWQISGIKTVVSLTFVTKIVLLLTATYFTIATETRLANPVAEAEKSREWYMKSIEICSFFLPSTSALSQHIQSSFQKHFKNKKSFASPARKSPKKPPSRSSAERKTSSKVTPSKRLTTSTRGESSKIRISRLKNSSKVSPNDSRSFKQRKSKTLLKELFSIHGKSLSSGSDSFDCKV